MKGLITKSSRNLSAQEFHGLAEVPPEREWFANINNEKQDELTRTMWSMPTKHSDSPETACIDELDSYADEDAEQLWIEKTRRRYEAFTNGELEAHPGEEVMYRICWRLK